MARLVRTVWQQRATLLVTMRTEDLEPFATTPLMPGDNCYAELS